MACGRCANLSILDRSILPMPTQSELNAAIESLTEQQFADLEANLKLSTRVKIETVLAWLVMFFGSISLIADIAYVVGWLLHPNKAVSLTLAIVAVLALLTLQRFLTKRLMEHFCTRGLTLYMQSKGFL